MERLVTGLFEEETRAQRAVEHLLDYGVEKDVIGVLMHGGDVSHEDVTVPGTKVRSRMVQGGAIGAGFGALLGGAILGPLGIIGVGALAAALLGAPAGAIYGTVAGALTGRDSDKEELQRLAREVEQGKILVTAVVQGRTAKEDVEGLLRGEGALAVQTM